MEAYEQNDSQCEKRGEEWCLKCVLLHLFPINDEGPMKCCGSTRGWYSGGKPCTILHLLGEVDIPYKNSVIAHLDHLLGPTDASSWRAAFAAHMASWSSLRFHFFNYFRGDPEREKKLDDMKQRITDGLFVFMLEGMTDAEDLLLLFVALADMGVGRDERENIMNDWAWVFGEEDSQDDA